MEFLDKFVLPQSAHHMELLKTLLIITYLLFIPYLSVLFGSLSLSLIYNWLGKKRNNKLYLHFAKDLIDLVTVNKSISFGLGVIPLLSAIFCYAQLLHGSGVNVGGYLLFALLTFVLSIILVYLYKYSFHLKDIFQLAESNEKVDDKELKTEITSYKNVAQMLYEKTGKYALLFLVITIYFVGGSIQLASDSTRWGEVDSFIGIIWSLSSLTYFLYFIIASVSITSASLLYVHFRDNNNRDFFSEDYKSFFKKHVLSLGLIFTIAQPLFYAADFLTVSESAVSGSIFAITLFILVVLLLISHLFYAMLRDSSSSYINSLIFLFVLLYSFVIVKEQMAFSEAEEERFIILADNYESYKKDLQQQMGMAIEEISGAEIYNGRCVACHQFDKKLVGPPHNEVLPKYEGKKDELVNFILNPVKINPEYPAMPNQGLKPNEAEAVAEFLLNKYKEQK